MQDNPFLFQGYSFDAGTGALRMDYAYADGTAFTEVVTFAPPHRALSAHDHTALDRIFKLVFLLAGVSYYKARVPSKLVCNAFALDADTAAFLHKVYLNGLGEFAFENKLNLNFSFENTNAAIDAPLQLALPARVLVPVGGGKDSVVTLEALKQGCMDVTCFALGGPAGAAQPIADCIRVSGQPSVFVSRIIAPSLIELNKQTGVYNGHVPITAILSAIALACTVLYGFNAVVMSNEHSASAPNMVVNGLEVNHQYSKSFAFERDLAAYIATHISPDITYLSFLRPCSELDITRRFAKLHAYHNVFRSCNTAFKQNVSARGTQWCCNCPKCRFVFLALAPFMAREKLTGIFGANMLDDATQIDGFAALCGVSGYKPFECVGEVEESAAVMKHLASLPAWRDDVVVKTLATQIAGAVDLTPFFKLHDDHALPPEYLRCLT